MAELVAVEGSNKQAIKKALIAQVKQRRQSTAMLDWIDSWEAVDGPIEQMHLDWADEVLDRQKQLGIDTTP